MVERFIATLSAPIRGLHQAAYVLALLTLASQVLALLRDRTFAHYFGAGESLDLYYAAFRVPDLVFALVASLVSAYVLIPRLSGKNPVEMRALLSEAVSFLLIVGGVLGGVLFLFAPQILSLLYPAFASSEHFDAFVLLSRLLLLQPIILGLSGVLASVTQVHRRFVFVALSPVLYNLGIIVGVVFLYPQYGLLGIGFGVVGGAVLHALVHVPVLLSSHVFPRLVIPSWVSVRDLVQESIPRSLALTMGSLTLIALIAIAALGDVGSVSILTLAINLEAVPLSLIGASYAVAAFPALSEHMAANNREEFTRVLASSAKNIILWSLVFVGLVVVLRAHVVRTVLGTGAFDWDATRLTAALLAILIAGLAAQGLVLLFSRALYAAQRSWWPLLYQIVGGLATVGGAFLLLQHAPPGLLSVLEQALRVVEVPGTPILFIALAFTVGQWVLALASLVLLERVAKGLMRSLAKTFVHGLLAALSGGVASYVMLQLGSGIAPLTTFLAVFTEGLIAGIVGLAAAAAVLTLLKNEEFKSFVEAVRRLPGMRTALSPSATESA